MRIDGVATTVLESWVRRDYGLSSAQLKVVIELRDGVCPAIPLVNPIRGITARDVYLARVLRTLPEMAKPRCQERAGKYTGQLCQMMFPKKQPT